MAFPRNVEITADRPRLRVAMALYADVTFDSRVIREAETLAAEGHTVSLYCLSGAPARSVSFRTVVVELPGTSVLPDGSSPFLGPADPSLPRRAMARARWAVGYARSVRAWGRAVVAAAGEVDVWHVHDLTGLLAVAPLVPPATSLVYDSHEIFLETGTAARLPATGRRLLQKVERRLAGRATALITVNDACARVLARRLKPRRVLVVRNCPPRWTPGPGGSSRLRDAAAIPPDATVALYHGALSPHRGIEELVAAVREPGMEAVHAVFLGFGALRDELAVLARDPASGGRLHLLDPVPPDELLAWVSGADVAVIPVQRSTLNHWLGSPNKLWEALAAGVPVVVSDFPEMRRVALGDQGVPLGGTCDPTSPASIAHAIRTITGRSAAERDDLRARCLQAAHERWNWETEATALVALYEDMAAARAARVTDSAAPGTMG